MKYLIITAITITLFVSMAIAISLTPSDSNIELTKEEKDIATNVFRFNNLTIKEYGCSEGICYYDMYRGENKIGRRLNATDSLNTNIKIANRDEALKGYMLERINEYKTKTQNKKTYSQPTLADGKIGVKEK